MTFYALKIARANKACVLAPDFSSAYQVDAPYSFWNLRSGERAADWLKLPRLVLQNDARLTDLIDVVGFNHKFTLLCSKAFLNSLEKYTTAAYEVFPVPVFDGLKAQTYYLLNWFQASNELIDFPQSEFAIPPQWTSLNAKKVEQKVEVRDLEHYDQLKKEHLSVTASRIVLKPQVPYHLFRINAGLKHPLFRIRSGNTLKHKSLPVLPSRRLHSPYATTSFTTFRLKSKLCAECVSAPTET